MIFSPALCQGSQCAAHHFFLRPGGFVHKRCRGLLGIVSSQQCILYCRQHTSGKENHHTGAMTGKFLQCFRFRDRGAACHSGNDHGLADGGQGVLGVQRCRTAKTGHPRCIIIGNAPTIQRVHLFPYGAINAGITGMQPHRFQPCIFFCPHHIQDLFQCHLGTVVYGTAFFGQRQQRRINKTSCIDNTIRFAQQFRATHCDQIRCPGPRSHKMNHLLLLYQDRCKIAGRSFGIIKRKIRPHFFIGQSAITHHGTLFKFSMGSQYFQRLW